VLLCVTISNYSAGMIGLMNPQQPRKSQDDKNDVRAFLKVGAEVQKSAVEDANEAYGKMMADGKLDGSHSGRKEIAAAVANQSLLITAQHYVNNPPAHGEQSGLHNNMKSLEHAKGPSWICQNGNDMNLGGSGDQKHSVEIQESSDNDSIEAW
jgi:hypothetical protein